MKNLFGNRRCDIFKKIASSTWNRIVEAHEVGIDLPEIGITADILVKILKYSRSGLPTFDVFARKSLNENTYGGDLDVFVEVGGGKHMWFALQAKILKKNRKYDTLRDTSDPMMQWEKLSLLEALTGCKAYYLLYNGVKDFSYSGPDSCSNLFDQHQFGCSLVEPADIKIFAEKKKGTRYDNPNFSSIHPNHAQPWKTLVCCNQLTQNRTLYRLDEILESNPNLIRVSDDGIFFDTGNSENDRGDNIPSMPDNRINVACQETGWNPDFRIIIRTNETAKKAKFGL